MISLLDSFWKENNDSHKNIQETLKAVKAVIRSWGGSNKNQLQDRIQVLNDHLDKLDKQNGGDKEKGVVRKELVECFEKQVSMVKQKSRFKWIV